MGEGFKIETPLTGFSKIVYFNGNDANSATVFSIKKTSPLVNDNEYLQNNDDYLYIGEDNSVWISNGGGYSLSNGNNLYNSNGTLTNDRTINQNNKRLTFTSNLVNGFSVDGSTFSIDALNNMVGMGTLSPAEKLDVVGKIKANDQIYSTKSLGLTTTTGYIYTRQSNTTGDVVGDTRMYSNATGYTISQICKVANATKGAGTWENVTNLPAHLAVERWGLNVNVANGSYFNVWDYVDLSTNVIKVVNWNARTDFSIINAATTIYGAKALKFPVVYTYQPVRIVVQFYGTLGGGGGTQREWKVSLYRGNASYLRSAGNFQINGNTLDDRTAEIPTYTDTKTDPFTVLGMQTVLNNTSGQSMTITGFKVQIYFN